MKTKPIRIDWEDLEDAFSNQHDEPVYLDRVTGHVVLEGEGEEDDLDDDPEAFAGRVPAPRVAGPGDSTRVRIHAPETPRKLEWMKQFLASGETLEAATKTELEQALSADDPAEALSGVLNRNPDVRDAWYMFRAERVREVIDAWISEHEIAFTEPPPWSA